MKKSPVTIIEPERETGIYTTPAREWLSLPTNKKPSRAALLKLGSIYDLHNQRYDLDARLDEAERYATVILEAYQPPPISIISERKTDWFPSPTPDKKRGIPDNVKQQVNEADTLKRQVFSTRRALAEGNIQQAVIHAYWVGRYYEALRVRQQEYVAAAERHMMTARKHGHEGTHGTKEEKHARWTAYQEALNRLAVQNPSWTLTALRSEVAKQHGVSFKTIERRTHPPETHG